VQLKLPVSGEAVRLRGHADANLPPGAARRLPERAARLLHPPCRCAVRAGRRTAVRPRDPVAAPPELGAGPPAGLGQRLCRLGPRPHRHRAAAGSAGALFARRRPAGVRRRCDHLAALRRRGSPERGYYDHPSRHSAGQPIIAGWAFQWIAQLGFARDSWTARWTPAGCTRPTTPTTPPPCRSARSWSGCLPAGRCHGLCLTAATTRPSCPWTLPRSRWRCWCGCDPTAASTPTRHHGHPAARAGRVATGPSSTAPIRPPGRSRPPP
jgi:hypothetical protein